MPKTIPYCLRSMTKSCDFDLEKIIGDPKLYSLIKEKLYIENTNAILILIDTTGDFQALEAKLMDNNQKYFNVIQLDSIQIYNIIKVIFVYLIKIFLFAYLISFLFISYLLIRIEERIFTGKR